VDQEDYARCALCGEREQKVLLNDIYNFETEQPVWTCEPCAIVHAEDRRERRYKRNDPGPFTVEVPGKRMPLDW